MKYITFGKDEKKVSRLIIGLMRISEMTTSQVTDLLMAGLDSALSRTDPGGYRYHKAGDTA